MKPRHIGIILDGNRRFSKQLMKQPWEGHALGAKKVHEVLEWARDEGIKEVTFYAFSMQNFHRPKKEFTYLIQLFEKELHALLHDHFEEIVQHNIKIRFLGRIHLFPDPLPKLMRELMEKTKHHDTYHVNFAMAYGGREEIIDAIKQLLKDFKAHPFDPESLSEEQFARYLYLSHEPDLIIRTGGEIRTSNFLPWQSIYSEWFFVTDKMWPAFTKEDFKKILQEYEKRERRFGK